jgi:N utilization substance protein B
VLYGFGFEPPVNDRALKKAVEDAPMDPDMPPSGDDYVLELVSGVWNGREELDALVQQNSQNWKVGRIAKVELTILRLALYEILHVEDIPLRVALNEAVELAKEFGDENSPAFVNGILDAVAKAVDQKAPPGGKKL